MLTRYDRLEIALERRGVSLHRLWTRDGIITRYTYRKIKAGAMINDDELAAIANAVNMTVDEIISLID